MIFYAVQVFLFFLSCDHSFLVLLVSYDLFSSLLLYSGLMFPCRASGVVISCRLLSRGLFLASVNALSCIRCRNRLVVCCLVVCLLHRLMLIVH